MSNRDVNRRQKGEAFYDTLAAIALNPETGRMRLVGYYRTTHMPRSFCIDLDGKFIYVAGQQSANVVASRIDQKTGALKQLATYETGGVPIWVMCGRVAD